MVAYNCAKAGIEALTHHMTVDGPTKIFPAFMSDSMRNARFSKRGFTAELLARSKGRREKP
jgi:hypothetical protein